eukprot:COSAG02_NODE_67184_length_253_cov_1.012987_1_plen_40_part_10
MRAQSSQGAVPPVSLLLGAAAAALRVGATTRFLGGTGTAA